METAAGLKGKNVKKELTETFVVKVNDDINAAGYLVCVCHM